MTGSREKENFSLDVLGPQFAAVDLGRFTPKICRFDFDHVANDQPFQFRQCDSLQPRIWRANGWVLAHQKHAFHFSIEHVVEILKEGVVTDEFGKPTVAETVFCGRAPAIVSFECAHEVFRVMRPEACFFRVIIEILLKPLVALARHCEVARKNIVKRWNIGRTLDRRVTA